MWKLLHWIYFLSSNIFGLNNWKPRYFCYDNIFALNRGSIHHRMSQQGIKKFTIGRILVDKMPKSVRSSQGILQLRTFWVLWVWRHSDHPHKLPDPVMIPQEHGSIRYPSYSSMMNTSETNQGYYQTEFGQGQTSSLHENFILMQKFTIREISPQWCYAYEGAKVYSP